jgi:hypothetical protein
LIAGWPGVNPQPRTVVAMKRTIASIALAFLAACGGAGNADAPAPNAASPSTSTGTDAGVATKTSSKVDPRSGGLEVALGEWASRSRPARSGPGR